MSEKSAFDTNDASDSAFETNKAANSAFETDKPTGSAFVTNDESSNNSAFANSDSVFEDSEIPQCSAGFIVEDPKDVSGFNKPVGTVSAIEPEDNGSVMEGSDGGQEPANPPVVEEIAELNLVDLNGNAYRLRHLKKLGAQGAMGEAYKADLDLFEGASSRKVLFKRCLRESRPDKDKLKVRLFINESEFTCRNRDPHIIEGIFYGMEDGRPFLVSKFYEGETLKKKIENKEYEGKYEDASTIVIGILNGLERLHNQGIVHRDLKPENIIVQKENNVPVIIDLGLARESSFDDIDTTSIGTKAYGAPEQFNGGEVTCASDVYAVGIILLEMLTGCRDVASTKKLVVEGIRSFVERCCQKNPDNRFVSAREARAKLEYALKSISNPEKQLELFEKAVAERFCDDGCISELEADALREIASRYCLSENVARDVQERLCKAIKKFREKDLIENILDKRPSDLDLEETAEKLHISDFRDFREWRKKMLSDMQRYANALQLSDESSFQEILEKYPFFKEYDGKIRAKFRNTTVRTQAVPSKASTKKSNRGNIIGIATAALFVILCFALYPKNAEKSSDDKMVAATTSEVKSAEAQVQPSIESDVPESNTFVKPEIFDDSKEFFDSRDGRVYKLLNYADKVWLVGNLSYADKAFSFAKCYDNSRSCEEFGRLYDYESAKKACPTGFRLPLQEEWERVLKKVGPKGADKLKSYDGFAALSAGYYQKAVDAFFYKGELAGWWVGDSQEKETAKVFNMFRSDPMLISKESVNDAYSVRCVKE